MMNRNSEEYKNLPQVSKDFLWHVEWHRKLWDWIYKNKYSDITKEEYPHEIINGLKINDIEHSCFCCEYACREYHHPDSSHIFLRVNCDQCFIYWPEVNYEKYEDDELNLINVLKWCDCESSIYIDWINAIQSKIKDSQIKNLAKQIRDLPLEYDFIKGFLGKERSS